MMSILRRRTESQSEHFVVANFEAYQDGALTEADKSFYRQHLAACQECQDWENRQIRLIEGLEIELSPPYRLSPAAAERIHQNLYRRMRRANLMNNIRTSVGAVAAIAVIAIVVGVFIWWQSGNTGATAQTTALEQESTGELFDSLELANEGNLEEEKTDMESVEPIPPEQAALDLEGLNQAELDTLLLEAVRSDDLGVIEQLLEAGVDPNAESSSGSSVLLLAAVRGSADIARLLIDHGADVNAPDGRGNPILPQVAGLGHLEVVKLLLDEGADIEAKASSQGVAEVPAIVSATGGNHIEVVELLISRGAALDAPDAGGRPALTLAANNDFPDIGRLLVEKGAKIDVQDNGGKTALHFAVQNDNAEFAQLLIDNGASLDLRTAAGLTPLDLATTEEMVQLLGAAEAKESVATSQEDIVGKWKSPLGYDLTFGPSGAFNQTIKLGEGGGFYYFDGEQLVLDSKECRTFDAVAQDWKFFECTALYTVYVTKEGDSAVMLKFELIDDPAEDRRSGFVRHPWKRVED